MVLLRADLVRDARSGESLLACPAQDTSAAPAGEGCDRVEMLVILHKTERQREGKAELGIGKPPTGRGFDPADPVRDRVAMDPKDGRRLGQPRLVEHRT